MKKNRRKFIQLSGTFTVGSLLLPHFGCTGEQAKTGAAAGQEAKSILPESTGIDQFGIQLYTLRDILPQDPKGILRQLSEFGYQQIESYEGDQGIFWGMKNTEFKKYMDKLGMSIVASHCDIYKDFETKVKQAAEIGMDYLICPHVGPQKSVADWKKITDKFNECGELCKKHGINFAYHNHAYSFKAFSGMIPHDFIMDNTDAELVKHEMDIYWVVTSGTDPVEYLTKYPNRFKLCHVKDRMQSPPEDAENASCTLGTGVIDYSKILKVAKEQGMEYFIVEQERYDNTTPLASAKDNAAYMAALKLEA